MANGEVTTGELLDFLKENMVTKEEFQDTVSGLVTKELLQETESRLVTHIDRFAKLHETLDQELVALRSKYERLEGRLEIVEQKLGLAAQ